MAAQTLTTSGGSPGYVAHMKEHRKRIMLCYDRVKAKAKTNPGAAARLAQYDATLARYDVELASIEKEG